MRQKVLLVGSSGFLGKSLYKYLSVNYEVIPTHTTTRVFEHSEHYDFFRDDLRALLERYSPEIIVMAAAVEKDVDDEAFKVGVQRFVEACRSYRLVYLSSDALFDGEKGNYSETDLPSPTTPYGRNLEVFEKQIQTHVSNHLIIRPSYLYGFSLGVLDSRLATTLERLRAGETVSYFDDMFKSPLEVNQAARIMTKLIEEGTGILHVAGERKSVYDFQLEAMQALGVKVDRLKSVQMPKEAGVPLRHVPKHFTHATVGRPASYFSNSSTLFCCSKIGEHTKIHVNQNSTPSSTRNYAFLPSLIPFLTLKSAIIPPMLTAIVFLLILTTAVVVHELAHYWNAKSVGLPVRSFSVGMGPVLFRKMWRGTEWRISLLPIGGYVDIPGMAPKQDEMGNYQHPDEGFATKNVWQKIWVLIGGVIANFILAVVLLAVVITADPGFRTLTAGIQSDFGARIAAVEPGMTAEQLGIQAEDVILKINDVENPRASEVTATIRSTAGTLTLLLERNGEEVNISTPWPPENVGEEVPRLGIQIQPLTIETPPSINFFQAMGEAVVFYVRVVPESLRGFVAGIGDAAQGRQSENVAGIVGIVGAVDQARRVGFIPVIALAAFINFSLALFNLLPIPGLDGGRILLASIVALRGKPFKPGQEEFIHFLGFMSVLALMLLITFNEVTGLFRN